MKTNFKFNFSAHIVLILGLFMSLQKASAQTVLSDYEAMCTGGATTFAGGIGPGTDILPSFPNNNYGDMFDAFNPVWFYFEISDPGLLEIAMSTNNGAIIDAALWGPFSSTADFVSQFNDPATNTFDAPVDSDYSGATTWTMSAPSVAAGEFYVMLISNYDNAPTDITLGTGGSTATTNCGLVPGNTFPGGISSNIALWLKADAGTGAGPNVSTWEDQSPNGMDAVAFASATGVTPVLVDNEINFNPGLDFNLDRLDLSGFNAGNDFEYIVVFQPNTTTVKGLFDSGGPGQLGMFRNDTNNFQIHFGGPTISVNSLDETKPYLLGLDIDTSPGQSLGYYQDSFSLTNSGSTGDTDPITWTTPNIGTVNGNTNATDAYNGTIAEVIIYNTDITDADRIQIFSYLAIKYGITMDQSAADGAGIGDYLASDGTVIFDAPLEAATAFNNDITGIGRDDDTALNQKQSKSVNANGIVAMGLTTIETSNSANTATFANDKNFMVWANNDGANTWTATGAPSDYQILGKQWQIQEVGTVGAVTVRFDVADTDFDVPATFFNSPYYIIYDSDNDDDLSDETPVALSNTSGDIWETASTIDFASGMEFSLATSAVQPECVAEVDFNDTNDLTDIFNSDGSPEFSASATGGISNSGSVIVPLGSNDIWTTKQGYSVTGAGDTFTFSAYFKVAVNSGYGNLGFSNADTNTGDALGQPATGLGVNFHGGGGAFVNNGTTTNLSWPPDLVLGNWYFMTYEVTYQGADTFDQKFQIWNTDVSGVLGSMKTEEIQNGVVNTDLGTASTVHAFFSSAGSRMSAIDLFKVELGGNASCVLEGVPVVASNPVSYGSGTTATSGGEVLDDRGETVTARGVVWSTAPNPSIADNTSADGTGLGTYSSTLTGLVEGQTYYVRSYAQNTNGIGYGTEIEFFNGPTPGGVSTDLALWLKADNGVTDPGTAITAWLDQSGNSNNLTTVNGDPDLQGNILNFNPVVDFDGNDYFDLALTQDPNAALEMIVVSESHLGGGSNQILLSAGPERALLYNTTGVMQSAIGASSMDSNTSFATNEYNIHQFSHNTSNGTHYLNGLPDGTSSMTPNAASNPNWRVGARNAGLQTLDGSIAEIIVYDANLGAIELQRIDSYLAVKYGISLDQTVATDYLASDGSTIWEAAASGNYNNDIAGIGQDDAQALDQKISKSVNDDALVTIALDNVFTEANNDALRTTSAGDGNFLVWSNNDGGLVWTSTGAPANRRVINRKWRVEENGIDVGTVFIRVPDDSASDATKLTLEETTVYLLVDNDDNFANAGGTNREIALTLNGNYWEGSVNLADGEFFTFATQTNDFPGSVSANVQLWLDASDIDGDGVEELFGEDGVTLDNGNYRVDTWVDKATINDSGNDVSNGNTNQQPYLVDAVFNGKPALDFDLNDRLTHTLGANWSGDYTVFMALQSDSPTPADFESFFSNASDPNNNGSFQINYRTAANKFQWTGKIGGNTAVNYDFENFESGSLKLFTVRHDPTTNDDLNLYSDGEIVSSQTVSQEAIFRRYGINTNRSTAQFHNSKIAEVLVYDRALTPCEIEQVNNYLGAKYGRDFSGFTTSYNGTGAFTNDVNAIGIAASDCGGDNQVDSMFSSELFVDNPSSNDTLGEFMIFAHDGSAAEGLSTNVPAGVTQRQARAWYVEEETSTNGAADLGTVDLEFDLSAIGITDTGIDNYALLIDADGDFSDATIETTTYTYANGKVKFTGIDIDNGEFIAIAVVDNIDPDVTIEQAAAQADPNAIDGVALFTVTFSEPIDVATFDCADITIGGTATATCTSVTEVAPNDKTTFELLITGTTNGTVIPTLAAATVQDILGNDNTTSTSTDNSVTLSGFGYDVSGIVYYDEDGEGDLDGTEMTRLQNVSISLYDDATGANPSNGTYDGDETIVGSAQASAAGTGAFTFTGIPDGSYFIVVDDASAALNNDADNGNLTYGATTAKEILVSVSGAAVANRDFGFDDAMVSLSIDETLINESGATPNFADVTATVVPTTAFTTTVNLSFSGTAIASDYTTSASSITIAPNTSSDTARITAVMDANIEADETVIIDIDTITNGSEEGAQQVTTAIKDDYLDVIIDYADNNTNPTPTETNYSDAGVTGVTVGNVAEVNAAIDALVGTDVDTLAEVQAIVDSVDVLIQIGNEGDDPDTVNSVVTVAELGAILPALTDVVAGNETAYQDYIDANPNSFSVPATQAEVQAMITAVNTAQTVLAEIGADADAGSSDVTIAELNSIEPSLTDVTAGNLTAYQAYIAANADDFSAPATQAEVQAMITAVNTAQTVLAEIGADADAGSSDVSLAELNSIEPSLTGVTAGNLTAYQAYIAANADDFGTPATQAEVQAMITAVNTAQTVLAEIGADADAGSSDVTIAELNSIEPSLTGVVAGNEAAYQAYIAANADDFGTPATQAEVQAMITAVNTAQTVLAEIGADADAGSSDVSLAELNSIEPSLTDVVAGNLTAYQAYIAANADDFSAPATQVEVQAMITAVNTAQTVLAEIGADADAGSSDVTIAELNSIEPSLTDVTAGNLTAYQAYIAVNADDFSAPATQAEVQAMITAVNTAQTVLAEIGADADAGSSDVTIAELNSIEPSLTDVTAGNETAYQAYIAVNADDFSAPATQAEVQAMITAVNTAQTVLAEIGADADAGSSDVTIAELNSIEPSLTGVVAANELAYQAYIAANADDFSAPATQAEVQAMITAVNASETVLAEIGADADAGSSDVTIGELNSIEPSLTDVTAGNEAAYQAYIAANADDFSAPATQAEVQAMITSVNAAQDLLTAIGIDEEDGAATTTNATAAQLNDIVGVSGALVANEGDYQDYIDANAGNFSSPATATEVQAMIDSVNAAQDLLTAIGIDEEDGAATTTNATAVQLNDIVGVSGALAANEGDYQDYIDANAGNFSSPATAAEVQAMIDSVNAAQDLLAAIGIDEEDGAATTTNATAAQLNDIVGISGALAANEGDYQDYIDENAGNFSSPATAAEVQAMIDSVNAAQDLLTAIGIDEEDGGATSTNATASELNNIVGVSGALVANEVDYQFYIDQNTGNFSSPATAAEVQIMIDAVNDSESILAQIGGEGDDPDGVPSVVTATELASIVGITDVHPGNEMEYQEYIDTYPNQFSDPATLAEVQAMIGAVNMSQDVLSQIGSEGDEPNTVPSMVTTTQLESITGIMNVDPANEGKYQEYIDTYPELFSDPATVAEIQDMIDAVNLSEDILAQIGSEGDDPDTIPSVVTTDQLNSITGIMGVNPANEMEYQDYIDAHPELFSAPATAAEIQDMIEEVNDSESILVQIGNEADSPDNNPSVTTVDQLNDIVGIVGVDPVNETLYQEFIDNNSDKFSAPATLEEVQSMINEVNNVAGVVANSNDPADGNPSETDLTDIGITMVNPDYVDEYEEAIANADPYPNSLEELQMIIDVVNEIEDGINAALNEILEDSNATDGADNVNGVSVTIDQLQEIPGLTDIVEDNEEAYQMAIINETGFSNPPTIAEIQVVIDAVNTLIDLVETADSPADGQPSNSDLSNVGITDLDPLREELYEVAIANASPQPQSVEELQAIIDQVNGTPLKVVSAQAFTPNGDGINDGWVIDGILDYPNNQVRVYNRSGHEVFTANGYQNDWDATFKENSEKLPPGSYYYIINLGDGSTPIDGWMFINY